jgi:mono/diheme cytochrome c family protein
MNKKAMRLAVVAVVVLSLLYWALRLPSVGNPSIANDSQSIARGAYLYNAAGCGSCHQKDGAAGPTGGHELESPFGGSFFAPNITPDAATGIGGWNGRDLLLAVKHGRSRGGGFYWPAFPYRSYRNMTDQDVLDVGAYLMSLPAIRSDVPDHDLPAWQFSWMMAGWNIMANFLEGTPPAITDDPQIKRGAYLARALGHCGECHTPRNSLGMVKNAQEFKGSEIVKAEITPEGLADWTADDIMGLLEIGMTPSSDFVGGEMAKVVEHTSKLSKEDREAYTAFILRKSN